jgi:hypothetical protein
VLGTSRDAAERAVGTGLDQARAGHAQSGIGCESLLDLLQQGGGEPQVGVDLGHDVERAIELIDAPLEAGPDRSRGEAVALGRTGWALQEAGVRVASDEIGCDAWRAIG